jgi:hypothetical protein
MDDSSPDTGPPTQYVTCDEIRRVFAEGRYFQRFQAGEFDFEVKDLGPPLRREGEQLPRGCREQIVRYFERDTGRTVALVHQRAGDDYGNPAPRTWADPKYVFHGGVRYKFSTRAR